MNESRLTPSIIIGIALVLGSIIFGSFYYSSQSLFSKDALSVTGSTKSRVTSDQAKLVLYLSRTAYSTNLSSGYKKLNNDLVAVKELINESGLNDADISESAISTDRRYIYEKDGNLSDIVPYDLNQIITVQSGDVEKVTALSKKIPNLADQGAIVSIRSLEYYYSKLPDLRVSLLAQAVKDAKARAEKIAEGSDRQVGEVQSVSAGVVQVLSPNSIDISDYGAYNTSSIEKEVMVTVKAHFRLE
jgi:hypothetical protein